MVWNMSQQYWISGTWDEQIKSFSLVPKMRMSSMLNLSYNFNYVSNENESYFIYSFYNSSTISGPVMDVSGQIQQMSWLDNMKKWNLFFIQPRQILMPKNIKHPLKYFFAVPPWINLQ